MNFRSHTNQRYQQRHVALGLLNEGKQDPTPIAKLWTMLRLLLINYSKHPQTEKE